MNDYLLGAILASGIFLITRGLQKRIRKAAYRPSRYKSPR